MLNYKIYIALLMMLFFSGCSYDFHFKDEGIVFKQRQLFNQLCNAKDRKVINKAVRADGYLTAYDSGSKTCGKGWSLILKEGYRYHECIKTPVYGYQIPANADIYHFTIENNGHPRCGTGKQWFIKEFHESHLGKYPDNKESKLWKLYREDYSTQLKGKCLVVQKVDRPKSQYMYLATLSVYDEHEKMFFHELNKKYPNNESIKKKGLIGSGDRYYFDMQTGAILAKTSNFTFFPKGRRYSFSSSVDCKEKKRISPSEIFIPKNKQK